MGWLLSGFGYETVSSLELCTHKVRSFTVTKEPPHFLNAIDRIVVMHNRVAVWTYGPQIFHWIDSIFPASSAVKRTQMMNVD